MVSSKSREAGALPAPVFLARYFALPEGLKDRALRLRLRHQLGEFARVCLGDRFSAPWSALHRELLDREKTAWRQRDQVQKLADAAPRGAAKSTLESWASILHDVVYGLEVFVCLISTTYSLSEDLAADLYEALTRPEAYPALHALYGPITVTGTRTDFVVAAPGGDPLGTRISAFSFTGAIRGKKHRGQRPSKVVVDDGEHPDRVRSPVTRAKTWDFLTKDILKAGDRYTVYRVIGTVLHPDSLLENLLAAPGWRSTRWRALEAWPTRMDLWDEARALWADLTDPERVATARRFYLAHQVEMDAGARVLWPEVESLWDLLVLFWEGASAFLSEKQNDPRDPDRAVFDPETFRRCQVDGGTITAATGSGPQGIGRRVSIGACTLAAHLDPAIGQKSGHDYSALALVAKDAHGYRYVLECSLNREPPSRQRARVWDLFERYPAARFTVEGNGFQALFADDFDRERRERQRRGQVWALKVYPVTSTQNKEDRISRLEPATAHGWLQFARGLPQTVIEQFRQFPTGAHDDAPDAIEAADRQLAGGVRVRGGSLPT